MVNDKRQYKSYESSIHNKFSQNVKR